MSDLRRFELRRSYLNTGPTETVLAEGCLWSDGSVTLRWIRDGLHSSYVSLDRMSAALTATAPAWIDAEPGYCGHQAQHAAHRWPDPDDGPDWCDGIRENCPHCPDGHGDPAGRSWGVYVAADRDGDGQPVRLHVGPSNGAHVAESDAAWLRDLIRMHG